MAKSIVSGKNVVVNGEALQVTFYSDHTASVTSNEPLGEPKSYQAEFNASLLPTRIIDVKGRTNLEFYYPASPQISDVVTIISRKPGNEGNTEVPVGRLGDEYAFALSGAYEALSQATKKSDLNPSLRKEVDAVIERIQLASSLSPA